ncbi:unnamed protein product [Lactuca saligna]|uniref:GDSL esterase/lipase n=1 Tax=Lactuca saligna TaxID=75948 RepID=A0AA36DY58_LACSI|nr:unnamed protein product [Lactuca saligna]
MATPINEFHLTCIIYLFFSALLFGSGGMCDSVPGIYILGDSLVDVGNNNHLPLSFLKANFPHNGLDFPTGKPTGRFSNGKNAADFLAEKVGLPTAPPYLSLESDGKKLANTNVTVTGVSFASGGAGILNGTKFFFQSITLAKQVGYYSEVHDQLVQLLGSDGARTHLAKCLFFIVIGSNDIFAYYHKNSELPRQYTPQQYVDLMTSTLKQLMKRLYELGARKFVVTGVGAIGCCPVQRLKNTTNGCMEKANSCSMEYNKGLQIMLKELKLESSDINYTYFDIFGVMSDLIQDPQNYGIKETKEACCGLGNLKAKIPCIPVSTYCTNRSDHLFWDLVHPTEMVSHVFADLIYSGSRRYMHPINVQKLVKM